MQQATLVVGWFCALVAGTLGGLAASQSVTGRPTYPLVTMRIDWTARELKLLGLGWAIFWLALSIYALVGSLFLSEHQAVPFGSVGWVPFILGGPAFQLLMEQRHNGRWPFRGRVSRT
jgi:hypothetical protein